MKRLAILIFILACAATVAAQVIVKEVIPVSAAPVGTTCVQGKIYYVQTTGVNYERINGVCAPVTSGGTPGDVVGPASSVDSEIAIFSGTGGKTLKRASGTGIVKETAGVIGVAVAGTDYVATETDPVVKAINGIVRSDGSTISASVVTNDLQTKASVVPNTLPSAGQILVGNAGGTAYAPISLSQDCTITSLGVLTCLKTNNVAFGALATVTPGTGVAPAAAVNGGSLGAFLLNNLAQDNAFVGDTQGIASAKSIGSCSAASSALTYNTTTHAWGCNTISSPSGANPTQSIGLSVVNGSAATFMRSDAAPALDQSIAPTMTGAWIFSKNGALSLPTVTGNGTWITGGSATTTKPYVLIEPSGTTSTNWNTSGTGLGLNAASGFAGNLLDLQVAAVQQAKITSAGTFGGLNANITNVSVYATLANALAANSTRTILIATNTGGSVGGIGLDSTYAIRFGTADSGVHDTSIWRSAAAEISFGVGANTGSGGSWKATNGTLSGTLTGPTLIGGTGTTSTLTLRPTSGAGTTNADIIFQVGNNGATEAMRITNAGYVGIGTASPDLLPFGSNAGRVLTLQSSNSKTSVLELSNNSTGTTGRAGQIVGYNGSTPLATVLIDADGATNSGKVSVITYSAGVSGTGLVVDKSGHIFMPNISTAAGATGADTCFQGSGATQEITTDTALCIVSARRFKNSIQPDHDGLAFIKQLRPVHYFLNEAPERGRQYGFVAEEVEKVNKDFVTYQKDGQIRSVLYIEIIEKLTLGMQEQQRQIETLRKEVDALKARQ